VVESHGFGPTATRILEERPALKPLVSVVIAAYNSGAWLIEAVESALAQTWPRREVIVVDDGSTVDLWALLEPCKSAVTHIRQENAGAGAARNTGVRAASGDFIAFLDHDDVWLPDKLATQIAVAARHPESGLIVCDGVQFDGERILRESLYSPTLRRRFAAATGTEITDRFYYEFLDSNQVACPAQTLIPRAVMERTGVLAMTRGEASDLDYYLRIAHDYPVTFLRDRLVRWRYLASSVSGPAERRSIEWAVMAVSVLSRHRALCAPQHRSMVASRLGEIARGAALKAFHYGYRQDRAYARASLLKLRRLAPRESRAALYLAALALPPAVVTALAQCWRQARGLWRAAD
jgi:glycosyltransferase involved in cell wall biosynthesis